MAGFRIAVGVLALGLPVGLAAQDDSALVAEVSALVRARAAADSFSGVVLIARGDRQLLLLSVGYRDRERRLPNEGTTKFAVASMTKMFTGVAVGQLAQQGRLRFSDTVRMLAPALPAALANRLTVHQLLTHTSGLGSIWGEEFRRRGGEYFHAPRDFYPLFVNAPLQFEPGSRWGYSNAGYVVLGDLIERVSGEGYSDYIRRHVFAPAGMSTVSDDELSVPDPERAIPYSRQLSNAHRLERADEVGLRRMMPAGGAVASAPDLWRFARALMTHKLLNAAYIDTVTTGKFSYRKGASYGFGFANEVVNGQTLIFHDGGAEGISANLDIFPATGHVAVVLSNYDHPAVGPIRDLIRARVTGR
jgi:CubicO group peptidase (beta-lactamase class C family)